MINTLTTNWNGSWVTRFELEPWSFSIYNEIIEKSQMMGISGHRVQNLMEPWSLDSDIH